MVDSDGTRREEPVYLGLSSSWGGNLKPGIFESGNWTRKKLKSANIKDQNLNLRLTIRIFEEAYASDDIDSSAMKNNNFW